MILTTRISQRIKHGCGKIHQQFIIENIYVNDKRYKVVYEIKPTK